MISLYWGKTFGGFCLIFLRRLLTGFQGMELQNDEIQVIVLVGISIVCALLGVFLVYRKMAMVANAITHTVLGGMVCAVIIAYFLWGFEINIMSAGWPLSLILLAALITSGITVLLIDLLTNKLHVQRDVSIGLIFTFLFAVGVVLATIFTRNAHIGVDMITGNVDLIFREDLPTIGILACSLLIALILFWRPLVVSSFDGQFASLTGLSERWINALVVIMTSLIVVVAMRAVGIVLVLALLITPVLTARFFYSSLFKLSLLSVAIGSTTSFFAVGLARHILTVYDTPLSTGGLMAALLFLEWCFAAIFAPKGRIVVAWRKRKCRLQVDFSPEEC